MIKRQPNHGKRAKFVNHGKKFSSGSYANNPRTTTQTHNGISVGAIVALIGFAFLIYGFMHNVYTNNIGNSAIEQPTPIEQSTALEQNTESSSATESVTSVVGVSSFKTIPKTVDYTYILRGSRGHITYTVYGGLSDYLKGLPKGITYEAGGTPPTDTDFLMRDLNDENQKQFLDPLVDQIKSITSNQDDQARIAISLVQNIPYDMTAFRSGNIEGKYPYEVLYTGCGVCAEKSELLAYLLKGLGYGVVIFRYDSSGNFAGHDAVGLKCPQQYSYKGTGYCFVESTTPTIITDSNEDYFASGNSKSTTKLPDTFKTLNVCDGNSFESVTAEYYDAIDYDRISHEGSEISSIDYDKWKSLVDRYGIKTSN
jgi:hypothetical protein